MPTTPDLRLWSRWFLTVTAAETIGFALPAIVGATLADAPAPALAAALIGAGLVEGGFLGAGQAAVLRRLLPGLPVGQYVAATAVAAALAYAIGLVPVLLGEHLLALDWPVLAVLGLLLGGALLATIGTAQWWVLRRLLPHAALWIPASAVAWLLGLGAFVAVSTPLWQTGQPFSVVVAIGVLGGLVMAAVVAAVTGAALLRLVRPALPATRVTG